LKSVASKELREYHSAWYTPEKTVVILAGNVSENEKKITEKVETWFGSMKGKATGDIEIVHDEQKTPKLEVVTKPDAQQAHMIIGLRTFNRISEDKYAWNIFNLLMGVGFTSRLFKEVREKRGLCYHIRSDSSQFADVGYWEIYAGVATTKVEEATKAIITELSKAVDKGVTDEEVNIAKKRLKTVVAFRSEDPEFFTEWYGRQEVYNRPLLTLNEYIKKIDTITKKDINALLKKYFKTETLNMALVWSKARDEKLGKLLSL
jgi:predicted Zn-dependent peptidase